MIRLPRNAEVAVPKEYVDIAVILPLEEEFASFTTVFELHEERSSGYFRVIGTAPPSQLRIVAAPQEQMGRSGAVEAASRLLDEFDVGLITCLGIAGGLSGDVRVGDVCCASTLIDILDNNKVVQDGDRYRLEFSPSYYQANRALVTSTNHARIAPSFRERYNSWREISFLHARELLPEPYIGQKDTPENVDRPNFFSGNIVCGPVTKSEAFNLDLQGIGRKLLAIETESGGVFSVAERLSTAAWCIRGISDYGDSNKNAFEEATKGNARKVAAANAASFLKMQLENPAFQDFVGLRRRHLGEQPGISGPTQTGPSESFASGLAQLDSAIDAKLRELSPAFKYKPKGYRLPSPRLQLREPPPDVPADDNIPVELRAAIQARDTLLISVPRNYADHSLAWIMASELLRDDDQEVQYVPFVVDGERLGPPSRGLEQASELFLPQLLGDGRCPVFLIENFPSASQTKVNFLIKERERFPGAKFLLLSQTQVNIAAEREMSSKLAASEFIVCDVSFKEMAGFLEKSFEMSGAEAEVAAMRLRSTFQRFDLSANPTYFAGITRETLFALLEANRRSELIQLAVDGFLSFVVAGDRANVVLSRTTRSRFLRELVFELKVRSRTFTQAELVDFTKEFASRYDFAIDPLTFVHGFVSYGVLRFVDDHVAVTLPFIESYLLALELVSRPVDAALYYKAERRDFDFVSFDIYAELAPEVALAEEVCASLEQVIERLRLNTPGQNILLTGEVEPELMKSQVRIRRVEHQIRKALETVESPAGNAKEKQRLLDLRDKAQTRANLAADKVSGETKQETNAASSDLDQAFRLWSICVILLGSGAEHLQAPLKRRLAHAVVHAASTLIDVWTRGFKSIDFTAFKTEVLADENLSRVIGEHTSGDETTVREFLNGMVDFFEYTILSYPFRRMLDHLCETSRQRVLAASLEKVEFDDVFDRTVAGTWLADLDASVAPKRFLQTLADLPPARFVRLNLATHLIMRVYWSHWEPSSRLALLNAAIAACEPLGLTFDKGRLMRQVEKDALSAKIT